MRNLGRKHARDVKSREYACSGLYNPRCFRLSHDAHVVMPAAPQVQRPASKVRLWGEDEGVEEQAPEARYRQFCDCSVLWLNVGILESSDHVLHACVTPRIPCSSWTYRTSTTK